MLLAIGAALCLAALAWALLGDSDEEKIRARLHQVAHAVGSKQGENLAFRALRLKSALQESLEPTVLFTAPELRASKGLQELTQLAAGAPRMFGDFDLSISDAEITIDEATQHATVVAEATLTGLSDQLRREARRVRFTLRKNDGEWRVSTIDAEANTTE